MTTEKPRNVTDVIDLEYLQPIQDHLGKVTGITTALLDPAGVPVSVPTNLHSFCAMMQASDSGLQMCAATNGRLIEINKETRGSAIVTCPNSGLRTAAVPIFVDEEYLGSWLIGQVRMEDVDYELIERISQEAGFSEEDARENMEQLPVIGEEEFQNTLSFLEIMTETLADLAKATDALGKRDAELAALGRQLDNSMQAFNEFIDFSDLGACLIDFHTGELIMCNSACKRLFDADGKRSEPLAPFGYLNSGELPFRQQRKGLVDAEGKPAGAYVWEHYLEELDRWLSIDSRALNWTDGRLAIVTTFMDITARKHEEDRISQLAYYDQRLGIPNAAKLHEDLRTPEAGDYLICFDVQSLRTINDIYSREAGDLLLQGITSWFAGVLEPGFRLYRIEGDDFAVLARGKAEEETMAFASRIAARFEQPWPIDMDGIEQNMYTGAHIGVIEAPTSMDDHSMLLNTIERVLSFARKEGKVVLFNKKINEDFQANIQYEMEFKASVLDDMKGFSLNYQPIVEGVTGNWVGLEALCRWESAQSGPVPPDVFIDTAEQLGLISMVSTWVLEEAVRQMKEWGLDMCPRFVLDVNLSPLQLRDQELLPSTLEILTRHDYPPEKLSLEITETSEVNFDEKTLEVLESIRCAGISLSLDDFGSGYASFSNLNNLPVNAMKTDRSFVMGIEEDAFLQQTVRSVIGLANAAGLLTIAEGIETEDQLKIMVDNGAKMIQGYYFSKPLTTEALSGKLDRFDIQGERADGRAGARSVIGCAEVPKASARLSRPAS